MRVNELKQKDIKVGLRIKSLLKPAIQMGTIISIDPTDDHFCVIYWDGKTCPSAGWYGNDSECEVELDEKNKPNYITLPKDMPEVTIARCHEEGNMILHLLDWKLPKYDWDWPSQFPKPKIAVKQGPL